MCKYKNNIDLSEIRSFLSYNPETGVFSWVKSSGNRRPAGSLAGSLTKTGYYEICYNNQRLLSHRLAWFFVYNNIPEGVIDHVNGTKTDNRICNLRCVSQKQNSQNSLTASKNSKSGVRGVYKNKIGSWIAQITCSGKTKYLGSFKEIENAKEAYLKAKKELHSAPILAFKD
jgi:hypothetical protein